MNNRVKDVAGENQVFLIHIFERAIGMGLVHVLDIIRKIFFSVFLNLLYCLLNLRFLIVI